MLLGDYRPAKLVHKISPQISIPYTNFPTFAQNICKQTLLPYERILSYNADFLFHCYSINSSNRLSCTKLHTIPQDIQQDWRRHIVGKLYSCNWTIRQHLRKLQLQFCTTLYESVANMLCCQRYHKSQQMAREMFQTRHTDVDCQNWRNNSKITFLFHFCKCDTALRQSSFYIQITH